MDGNLQAHSKSHSQPGGEPRQAHQQGTHITSASALNTMGIPAKSSSLDPFERAGKFHAISQEHSKFNIFISPLICTTCAQICRRLTKPLRSRAVRSSIFTSLTLPPNELQSFCTHTELHLLPASSSGYLLPALPCLVTFLLSRTNQQTWLLAASCVPRWCKTAAEEFPAISLPRAWGKSLTCQCLPSNSDLLRRKDLC